MSPEARILMIPVANRVVTYGICVIFMFEVPAAQRQKQTSLLILTSRCLFNFDLIVKLYLLPYILIFPLLGLDLRWCKWREVPEPYERSCFTTGGGNGKIEPRCLNPTGVAVSRIYLETSDRTLRFKVPREQTRLEPYETKGLEPS